MLWRRFTNAIVEKTLLFKKGAVMKVTSATNVETELDMAELASLQDIGAADLAKIDGITNGTVAAGKAVVVDVNKDASAFRNVTVTNLDAGASGTAGTVDVFPATALKGKTAFTVADNTGDTITTVTTAAQAAARTYTVPDAGASASFVMTEGAQTVNGVKTLGSVRLTAHRLINQPAPTAKTVSATLTAAEVLTRIITVNQGGGAASVLTLPTGTAFETDLVAVFPGLANDDAYEFSVVNISTVAAEDASVATNTGWTLVGNMDVASNAAATDKSHGTFRARRTAANTYSLYRVG